MRKIKDIFLENIRLLRKKKMMPNGKPWTQAYLAELADMPWPTYRDIENGNWPQEKNIEKIAKALNVPPSRLFADPDESELQLAKRIKALPAKDRQHIEMTIEFYESHNQHKK